MANHLFQGKERTFADSGYSLYNFVKADTEAGLPTSGITEGDMAYALDTDKVFKWNGSAWIEIVTVGGTGSDTWRDQVIFRPSGSNAGDVEFRSALSGWTQVDRATNAATWTQSGDLVSVGLPGALNSEITELHALLKAPAGFGIGSKITISVRSMASGVFQPGIIFTDGTTYGAGNQIYFAIQGGTAAGLQFTQNRFTNFNTFAAGSNSASFGFQAAFAWMRFTWVASNSWRYEASPDGVTWVRVITDQSYTITPTHCGLVVTTGSGQPPAAASFECFRIE